MQWLSASKLSYIGILNYIYVVLINEDQSVNNIGSWWTLTSALITRGPYQYKDVVLPVQEFLS